MDVRRAVAAVLLLGLLGGCSEDEPGADPPEPTSSVSTPPTPTLPAEAQGTDEASARAFVRYWFTVLSRSMGDGEVGQVRSLSSGDCTSCAKLAGLIEGVYADGGRFETRGWKVERIARAPGSSAERPSFVLRTRHTKRELFGASGKLVDSKPEALVAMGVTLVPARGSWQLEVLEELK